ncbi:MAG: ATP-binding cassette domain-containing protein [Firmicutes bacterium]|nr:ATP-binding cassette domain-containing protein [Bacillota bacterium]
MIPVIDVEQVSLERPHRRILDSVTWRMGPREHWVLLGPNGSGKTSLLTLLMGYEWPTRGRISVLGRVYGQVDLREVRKEIGWVSHHLAEWMTRDHGDARVNEIVASGKDASIGRGLQPPAADGTEAALDLFGLRRLAASPFRTLSQGEKMRALLARAWVAQARLLILDEPCSGLDITGREHFLSILGQWMRHQDRAIPVVYVTHHPEEILPTFTHALLLKQGRVLAQGPIDATLTSAQLSQAFEVPLVLHTRQGRRWVEVVE